MTTKAREVDRHSDDVTAGRFEVASLPVLGVSKDPMAETRLVPRRNELEAARKAARRGIVALLVAEGATPTDLARILGVSQQLASQLVLGRSTMPVTHDELVEAENAWRLPEALPSELPH